VRRVLPIALIALVAGGFYVGATLRADLGIEWSAQAVQSFVLGLGLKAPLIFLGLVTFRQFFFLTSGVLLTAGGMLFGAALGTLLGGAGIVLSALLLFFLARGMGGGWVRARLRERFRSFDRRARTAGPVVVGLMTGHPMGVMTPFHLAAGISGISWVAFLVVVLVAAPIRAATFAYLGANILDVGSARFWLASGLLVALALLPLAHPTVRRRVLRSLGWRLPERGLAADRERGEG
jgi:uncharacterized membrane protein YdjX (TVP38/TMEM64 family)